MHTSRRAIASVQFRMHSVDIRALPDPGQPGQPVAGIDGERNDDHSRG